MKKKRTIAFRIPEATYRELEARGLRDGLSAGQVAQRMVLDALADANHAEVVALVKRLRSELALGVMTLLADAGKASAEDAKEFVRRQFGDALN
jgi:hypothetical protein